jgi:hypothetical protein
MVPPRMTSPSLPLPRVTSPCGLIKNDTSPHLTLPRVLLSSIQNDISQHDTSLQARAMRGKFKTMRGDVILTRKMTMWGEIHAG